MRRLDIIRRAGRNLSQAKGRTLLTSLAIAVGAFTLTLSLAAGQGARQYSQTIIASNINPQTVYVARDKVILASSRGATSQGLQQYDPSSTNYRGNTLKALDQSDIVTLRGLPGVQSVTPMYELAAQYIVFQGISTKYVAPVGAYDDSIHVDTAAGTIPPIGTQIGDKETIIPQDYADTLGVSAQSMIGKTITVHLVGPVQQLSQDQIAQILQTQGEAGLQAATTVPTEDETFTIVGVSAPSSTSFTSSSSVYVSSNAAQQMDDFLTKGTSQYQKYLAAVVIAKSGTAPNSLKQTIQNKDMIAKTAQDLESMIFTVVSVLEGIVAGFGVITLIASVFGIINTQYISVLERISQIGLMKALGMRRKDIAKLFRYEAAWIGFLGGLIGSLFAVIVGSLLNPWITEKLSLGSGNSLLVFVWWQIVALIVALIGIAILAGWFPARKAARLDPIEALRTE